MHSEISIGKFVYICAAVVTVNAFVHLEQSLLSSIHHLSVSSPSAGMFKVADWSARSKTVPRKRREAKPAFLSC